MPSFHALYVGAVGRAERAEQALAEAHEQHQSEKRELERRLVEAAELALRLSCEVGRLRRRLQEEEADVAALRARLAAAERALDDEVSAEREELALAHEALDRAGVADDEMGLPLAVRLAELVARAERQEAGSGMRRAPPARWKASGPACSWR